MRTVFADTYFYIALLNSSDRGHQASRLALGEKDLQIVTTDFVLVELLNGLSAPSVRQRTAAFVRALQRNNSTTIRIVDPATLERALRLFESRPDKGWSLTDCTSFIIMQDLGISEALTGDAHFEQAGFRTLLRNP